MMSLIFEVPEEEVGRNHSRVRDIMDTGLPALIICQCHWQVDARAADNWG